MFGLDARIALAIFGALSVISGAALYSAIQQAKVTVFHTDINEITKAFESYYLDVGVQLALTDHASYETAELVTSNKTDWKGPYLSYPIDSRYSSDARYDDKYLRYNNIGDSTIYIAKYPNTNFPSTTSTGVCSTDDNCSLYIAFLAQGDANEEELMSQTIDLDDIVDAGDGLTSGIVIVLDQRSYGRMYLFYKVMDMRIYN